MAWTYSDWDSQSTPTARLTRLRLHLAEVGDCITAAMTSQAENYDPRTLGTYYEALQKEKQLLLPQVSEVAADDPRVTAGFVRGRPL